MEQLKETEQIFAKREFDLVNHLLQDKLIQIPIKVPSLEECTLSSNYCKINFKTIKKVCQENVDIFGY